MATELIMPKFGFTQEDSEVVAIFKQNGDSVREGDPLLEVTTDKVNMEVEAPASGILNGLSLKVGDIVPVATVIGHILSAKEAAEGFVPVVADTLKDGNDAAELPTDAAQAVEAANNPPVPPSSSATREVTPVAARLISEHELDANSITGTGPLGRVTRQDVEAFLSAASTESQVNKIRASPNARRISEERAIELHGVKGTGPEGRIQGWDVLESARANLEQATPGPDEEGQRELVQPQVWPTGAVVSPETTFRDIPFSSMRRAIARNLTRSYQDAPHIFFQRDVDMKALKALLDTFRRRPAQAKISMTVLLAKVVAWALAQHPHLNSHLDGETVRRFSNVNLGIAVALEEGLIVPVLRDVLNKGAGQLSVELSDLTARARANQLKASDLADGTFTISNLGMFGIDRFTAIINPPQVGILAVGATTDRFVPDANGQPVVRPLCTFTLSVDHRVVDGAVAAQFMATLTEGLQEPALVLY